MKKMLKSLFVGMIALMTTATVMAQTTCYVANGESTPITPKDWKFVGFFENSEGTTGYTPITANFDWRTSGVNSATIYSITTPVIDWNPLSSSIGIKDLQFSYLADFPTNTQFKVKIYVLASSLSGGQQLLHEFPLSVATDQANPAVFDLENSMTTATPVNGTVVYNWRIRLDFVSTSTDINPDYYFQIDNVDLGCQYKGTTSNNIKPVANAGADQTITAGSSATLSGSGSYDPGPSGDMITSYTWIDLKTGATVGTSSSITVTPSTTNSYRLYVEDMNGGTHYDDVTVTVQTQQQGDPNAHLSVANYAVTLDGYVQTPCSLGQASATRSAEAANAHTSGLIIMHFIVEADNGGSMEYTIEFYPGQTEGASVVSVDLSQNGNCGGITRGPDVVSITQQ